MILPFLFFISVSLCLGSNPARAADAAPVPLSTGWEQTDQTDDGITVFRKEIPGSSIIAFRGTAIIDAPIAKLTQILLDDPRAPEWAEDLEESKIIRWVKEPLDYYEYNHVGTPFILKDRDFVSHVTLTVLLENRSVTVNYETADDKEYPQTRYVRGDINGSGFRLTSLENDTRTFFDGVVKADPKGNIPKWLVNFFQKSWPKDTIRAIRKQALKPDVVEHPYFKALFHPVALATPVPSPVPGAKAPAKAK